MDGIDIVVKVFDRLNKWHENYQGEDLYRIPDCDVPEMHPNLNAARIFVHQFASKTFAHSGTDSLDFNDGNNKIIIVWVDGPCEELEDMVAALAEKFRKEAPVEV